MLILLLIIISWPLMMALVYTVYRIFNKSEDSQDDWWGWNDFFVHFWPVGMFILLIYFVLKFLEILFVNIKFVIDHYLFKDHMEKKNDDDCNL